MDRIDFFGRFGRLLENTKERHDLDTKHDALIVWFGEHCLSLDPDDVKERIVEDRHAEGIDAILVDNGRYELLFIQAKTVEQFDNTENNYAENDLKSTLEGIRFLLKSSYKGKITPALENLVDEYHECDSSGDFKTRVLFLTLKKSPRDTKFIDAFKNDFDQIDVDFWDFDRLHHFYENSYLTQRAPPPERISFQVVTSLLAKDSPQKSRVFTCKGEELARLYSEYEERIFQQNVRYSLGLKSRSINRQILETAMDSNRSKEFWYFNNGITIVCDEITEATSGRVINLKNPQIINGAQTTYALHEARNRGNLMDDVEVLIKAIQSTDRSFIEKVTLYTNSQNAIRLRDLCSNDEIQDRIQRILLDSYKYFYERKRGEFDSLYPTTAAKRQLLGNNYKDKLVTNENAAQAFLAMCLGKPAEAKNEKGRVFLKDKGGFYDDIFNNNDDIIAEKLLVSWKLLRFIEAQKKEYKARYKSAEDLEEAEKTKVYQNDFLLHSEYVILNIFRNFLQNEGLDVDKKREDLVTLVSNIDGNDIKLMEHYRTITETLAEYIADQKNDPRYYHTKFFKNETSIALIRNFFSKKHSFVKVL